jgi:hypothetical protein
MADLIFKIAGVVSYADGSHGPFEATLGPNDLVANPYPDDNLANFSQLGDMPEVLTDLFALLPGMQSVVFDNSGVDKEVTDVVMNITGTIARDDNTSDSFVIEYKDGAINHFPDETDTVWTEISESSDFLAQVNEVFQAIAGVNNASLA